VLGRVAAGDGCLAKGAGGGQLGPERTATAHAQRLRGDDPENQQGEGNPCPQRQRDDTRTYDPRELAADEPDGSRAF